MQYEIVTAEAPLGEGPVWCPDGTLVITQISPGGLVRIEPESGKSELVTSVQGGANSAQLAADGGFVVANNGGIDFTGFAGALGIDPTKIPFTPGPPGLQRVSPSGEVTTLAHEGLQAPNDLIVAPDGTIFFTDPPPHGGTQSEGGEGRFWSYSRDGELRQIASGFQYDNGVALSPDGRLLIVEARGLMWIDPDSGDQQWWVEQLPGESPGDGFAFDVDGRLYCACPMDHCIRVLDAGKQVEMIDLGEGAYPTNCCFGGEDRRTLFTTELAPGRVCVIEGLPTPGLDLTPWPTP